MIGVTRGVVVGVRGLRIVFGDRLDGGAWPPTPDGETLGAAVVGLAGLLSMVETCAGLAGPTVPAARRIATMRRRLARVSDRPRFWSASLAVDPWTVARELLAWRDDLVAAGWTATAIVDPPARLADLAALEALAEPPLPSGMSDRLVAATEAFGPDLDHPFEEIVVVDDRAALAPGVARLLDRMAANGVAVSYRQAGAGACPQGQTDLARVQGWLSSGKAAPLTADGTFVILRGSSEGIQSEAVADWLAAGPDNAGTVIILDRPTGLLDGALARRGLPHFAHLPASPLRGAIQVLSLAFAIRWRPFDPSPLLDLLSLPQSPVPGEIGRIFAAALTEAPGRDGPLWVDAIARGLAARRTRFEGEGLAGAELDRRVQRDSERWLPWLSGDLFDESPGMPAVTARDICAGVAAWSARLAPLTEGPVAAVGGFAVTLSQVIEDAGLDPLARVQLERMIDAVVAEGVDARHANAEAADWSHVTDPGQIWDEADTVLWWGLGADTASSQPVRWTMAERDALRAAGCLPDEPAAILARESAGWRRALLNARERAVLAIAGGVDTGEGVHPLLHELQPLLADGHPATGFDAERLLSAERIDLSGRSFARTMAGRHALPQPRGAWTLPAGQIRPRPVDGATSIGLLLSCPFAWSLQYPGRLNPSRRSEVPKGERLLGLVAHALAAEIFKPGAPPSPPLARQLADQRLPALIDEMATPLRLPGAAADYARALARLPAAMEILAGRLGELAATVIGTEVTRRIADVPVVGVSLEGRIDMLVDVGGDAPGVIDMKWSGSDRYRREEIVAGHSVQLAVYGRMVGSDAVPAPGAYFMLSQVRFLPAGDNVFGAAPGAGAPSLAEVWTHTRSSWQAHMNRLADGQVVARGEKLPADMEDIDLPPLLEPPCRFCDKSRLCGHARVL